MASIKKKNKNLKNLNYTMIKLSSNMNNNYNNLTLKNQVHLA